MGSNNMLRRIRNWLSLADYEEAKDAATDQVITRFARGNVSIQNGSYLDDKKLEALSRRGDAALTKLSRLTKKHADQR